MALDCGTTIFYIKHIENNSVDISTAILNYCFNIKTIPFCIVQPITFSELWVIFTSLFHVSCVVISENVTSKMSNVRRSVDGVSLKAQLFYIRFNLALQHNTSTQIINNYTKVYNLQNPGLVLQLTQKPQLSIFITCISLQLKTNFCKTIFSHILMAHFAFEFVCTCVKSHLGFQIKETAGFVSSFR